MSQTTKKYPKTVEEAVQSLLDELAQDSKDYISAMSEEKELYRIHHSLGRGIRNEMGLWQGNDCLLVMCLEVAMKNGQELTLLPKDSEFVMHPDDASHTILVELWKKLREEWVSVNAEWCEKVVSSACDNCPHWLTCPIAKDYLQNRESRS